MLHYVDKSSIDRSAPTVNTHDLTRDVIDHAMNFSNNTARSSVLRIITTQVVSSPAVTVNNPGAATFAENSQLLSVYEHDLGYTPAVIGYIVVGSENILMPYTTFDSSAGTASWTQYAITVDSTNVYVSVGAMVYSTAITVASQQIKFYLLQQSSA